MVDTLETGGFTKSSRLACTSRVDHLFAVRALEESNLNDLPESRETSGSSPRWVQLKGA